MKISRRPARLAFSLVTATAIVLGAGVSGAAASGGPGRSGEAQAEHGHPNPDDPAAPSEPTKAQPGVSPEASEVSNETVEQPAESQMVEARRTESPVSDDSAVEAQGGVEAAGVILRFR